MKPALAVSFVLAAICHALLLFCLHLRIAAKPLAMSDEGSPVLVTLVQPAAETSAAPPLAAVSPEPSPLPAPPTPESTPEPTPEIAPPSPTPAAPTEETMSTPAPLPRHHEKTKPHTAVAQTSAQGATVASHALPGAAAHGGSSSSSQPGYRYNPRPDYPAEARAAHQEGVVLLGVAVGADGHTTAVSLVKSSGYPLLDNAAIEAVRRWTFDPAREGGFPVVSRVDVPVRFTLNEMSH